MCTNSGHKTLKLSWQLETVSLLVKKSGKWCINYSCSYNSDQLSCPIFRFWNVWPSWWFERIQGRYMPDLIGWILFFFVWNAIPHFYTCMHVQGQSWSIGGDPGAQTVATFLRFYTPNIVGASLGKHFFEVRLPCFSLILFHLSW